MRNVLSTFNLLFVSIRYQVYLQLRRDILTGRYVTLLIIRPTLVIRNICCVYCMTVDPDLYFRKSFFQLSCLSYSYKLVKMLSKCVWMLTRVAQIVTAAHRDL